MAKHDAFRSWRHVVDESDELSSVAMSRESITGFYAHLDGEADDVASDVHWDFFCTALNSSSDGAFRLVTDKHEGVFSFTAPVFEVLHDRATVHHPTSC